MPILKREPDQFPPDLMRTEYESLKRAQAAVSSVAPPSPSKRPQESTANDTQIPSPDTDHASPDLGYRQPSAHDADLPSRAESSTAPSETVSTPDLPAMLPHDFGSFSYYSEYLGIENPPKPLTFWSGDWEDFQKFDPQAVGWWCLYTHSRQEKLLMRYLLERKLSFYCPMIEKRYRSPQGRMRSSFLPLFTNYVFLRGTDDDRRTALATNCVLTSKPIQQPDYLVTDLFQISVAVESGVPITAEQKLEKGAPVRVKSGPFKGFEGFVQRRAGATRFLIFLRYLEQGVSMEIDEGALVAI